MQWHPPQVPTREWRSASDSVFPAVTAIRITAAIHTLTDIIGRTRITVMSARRSIGPTATGFITGIIIGTTGTGTEPAFSAVFDRRVETPAGYLFGEPEPAGAELDPADGNVS